MVEQSVTTKAVEDPASGLSARAEPEIPEAGWTTARPPRPLEVLRRMARFPRLVREHRDLVATSVRRDLQSRFQGTLLGWFWPLVHPLFLFGVYYFIFTELLQIKMPGLPAEQKAAMGVYMFCGIAVWAPFAESLLRGTNVIVENGNLIKKLAFPSELLPLNVTLVGIVTELFGVAMFVLAALLTPVWPAPGAALLWIPLLVLLQAVFTYGLVLALSTLQVFLRDTLQLVGILSTVWMFLTPIFWAPEVLERSVLKYLPWIAWNPMVHLLQAWRGALMGDLAIPAGGALVGGEVVSVAAIPGHLAIFALWALFSFVLGYGFFLLAQRRFADEV